VRAAAPRTPWPVRAGLVLWTVAVGAGLVAVVTSAIDSTGLRADLYLSARAAAPTRTSAVLHDSVNVTIAGVAAFTGVVLLLVLVGTVLLHRRRRAARWLLPVAGVLGLVVAGLDQNLVEGGATSIDRLSFLVFGACVLAGLVLLPLRGSRAWLRRR
jgi:drug/metabolite transporter (DMT)-like permease